MMRLPDDWPFFEAGSPTDPNHSNPELRPTEHLLRDLQAGRPVILIDDNDRENEGDIVLPAENATEEWLAFIIRYTGGVICLSMPNELADHLELPPMVAKNQAPRGTAYTVSIEAAEGTTTGISAKDRALTIRTTVKAGVLPTDLVRPGHVFPLRAAEGGVLARDGHTEGSVDLARLAGFKPVAAISEVMHDDGTMMRTSALLQFGAQHGLSVGTIADLVRYRVRHGR
ncbi:MAG: 3,4-dihydroxy-2-butanone-4-phosphate synthase [Myxococcota bacterium]